MGRVFVVRKRPVIQIAEKVSEHIDIQTIDGNSACVKPDDWLMTGVLGEQYPCRDDVFQKTFEVLRDATEEDIHHYSFPRDDTGASDV